MDAYYDLSDCREKLLGLIDYIKARVESDKRLYDYLDYVSEMVRKKSRLTKKDIELCLIMEKL